MEETVIISPKFQSLDQAETFKNEINGIIQGLSVEEISHNEILPQLIDQIEPIDFESQAFPEKSDMKKQIETLELKIKEAEKNKTSEKETKRYQSLIKNIMNEMAKLKLTLKHYLILSIENILVIAQRNEWDLCKNLDFIYVYNGAYWDSINGDTFAKFLGIASEKMGVPIFSARYFKFRDDLQKQFHSSAVLPTPTTDPERVLINLRNGTFEISAKGTILRPFNASDFITYRLPFDYNPDSVAPIFMAYLNRVLPDKQSQTVLAEYMASIFIKHGSKILKEEKALILYGSGANGKSVFYEVCNALLGQENTSSYSLEELTDKSGYYRAMIANKLVNYASEINGKLQADTFKRMVSGEVIPARLPYGKPMQLRQYAKLIFNCNELPKDVEHTNAYFRRFLIIPFEVTIPEEEQDKTLHVKIIENELSGVFNWVLDGLYGLLDQKHFSECEAARNAVEQYKLDSNSIQMFLDEKQYSKSATKYERIKDLYPDYRLFCIEDGMKPFNKANFAKQLNLLGFLVGREGGTGQKIVYLAKEPESF